MKKAVQFRKDFGLDNDWKNLTMGDLIKSDIPDLIIIDLQMAIILVRASTKIGTVQLRQEEQGGTMEWDNF
jgi:hypothetical protein